MLDNVIDVSRFPLPEQRAEAKAKRRIGLGVTGLADALIFCRARYGSAESVALIERWLTALSACRLCAPRPNWRRRRARSRCSTRDEYLARPHIMRAAAGHPRRASPRTASATRLLTSIAPTGTISLFAGNVSSGIEPVFAYTLHAQGAACPTARAREEEVEDYAYRAFRATFGEEAALPDYFVNAQTLSPDDHLAVQAAAQKHIDSSISKTINVPADISFDAFKDVYLQAYEMGCKGCTTYRPNAVTRLGAGSDRAAAAAAAPVQTTSRCCRCRARRRRARPAASSI